jgi:PAS domain S-box-containing protein
VVTPKLADEKIKHLNLVLRVIRDVNRLIIEEKDRDRLVRDVCDNLVKSRGYFSAWVALLDKSGGIVTTLESGLGEKFLPMVEQLKRGEMTGCGGRALAESGAVVTGAPASTCADCPLAKKYSDRGVITVRLECEGRVYGILSASLPVDFITEPEETSLFEQVAGDIALGLRNIESEQERKEAEKALKESESRYRDLFERASDGIFVHDLEGNIIEVNWAAAALTGYAANELTEMNTSQLLSNESLKLAMERQQALLKGETDTQRYELELVRKDGTRRIIESVTRLFTQDCEAVGIQAMVRDITEQKRLRENMQFYISQTIKAQEEERRRIACELHDETAQSLAALLFDVNAIARDKTQLSGESIQHLEQLRDKIDRLIEGIRRFSHELRPPVLDQVGLIPTLELLGEEPSRGDRVNTSVEVIGSERRLSPEVELVLFRIAQEALRNVRKHSQATEALVKVEFTPNKVKLSITDNGQGFELPKLLGDFASRGKLGLFGMHERARLLGSNLSVKSQVGKGTTIALEVEG